MQFLGVTKVILRGYEGDVKVILRGYDDTVNEGGERRRKNAHTIRQNDLSPLVLRAQQNYNYSDWGKKTAKPQSSYWWGGKPAPDSLIGRGLKGSGDKGDSREIIFFDSNPKKPPRTLAVSVKN